MRSPLSGPLRRGRLPRLTALLPLLVGTVLSAQTPPAPPRHARFASCPLESGEEIRDCDVAYRTFGTLAADRRNVVVVTTWFLGRSQDLLGFYIGGSDRLLDSTRYFVVAIDAFGNGQSSSPSTSAAQRGAGFPRFTIRDMVAAQRRVMHEVLGVSHLRAVLGASMGGMQALQWSVQFPDEVDRVIAIVPTPRTSAYDRVLWGTELRAIENALSLGMPPDTLLALLEGIQTLALQTPAYVNRTAPDSAEQLVQRSASGFRDRFRPWDWASQLRAMLAHDVSAPYGGSLARAAARVTARTLLVYASQDHMVTPAAIADWARWTRAETVELTGDCGHLATGCEQAIVRPRVIEFLERR